MSAVEAPEKPARDEPLLELMFNVDPRGQVDSRTPVRWCVGRPMLLKIEELGFTNPYVVLVLRHRKTVTEYGETGRIWQDTAIYAAPLTQELQFINFQRSGRNDVRAFVVEMNFDTARWLSLTRKRINSGDHETIFEEDGTLEASSVRSKKRNYFACFFDTKARQRVIVDSGMFASEPAPWRKNLVDAYGLGKGRDQCAFRKRFWFGAMPLTLVGIPFWAYIPKIAMLVLFTFFGRLPNKGFWKTAINPLNLGGWTNSLAGFSPSMWWHGKQSAVLGVLNPPVLLGMPSVVWVILRLPFHHYHKGGHSHHSAWHPMSWISVAEWVDGILLLLVLGALVVLAVGAALLFAAGKLDAKFPGVARFLTATVKRPLNLLASSWKDFRKSMREAREERERQAKLRLEMELAAMTCRNGFGPVSVAALPKEKQTIVLRFNDFKTRVCRPFAAS